MTTKVFELAVQDTHGGWDHCGDFRTEDEAIAEALRLSRMTLGNPGAISPIYRDDNGTAVFGLGDDPDSGHYETRLEVYEDGNYQVF